MKSGEPDLDYIQLRQKVKERITYLLAFQFKKGALEAHPIAEPDWDDLDIKAEEILSLITLIWGIEKDA
jgi:hypothetical protein